MEFLEFKVNGHVTLIAKDAIKLISVVSADSNNETSKCMIMIGDESVDFVGTTEEVMEFYQNFSDALSASCKITQVVKKPKSEFGNRLPNLDNCVLIVEDNHNDIENS